MEEKLYAIDWEYAFIGDPAYDLAIVTRGAKRPFQASGGLERLLEAYLSSGGQEISKSDVREHELLLFLGWYEQSLARWRGIQSPEFFWNS